MNRRPATTGTGESGTHRRNGLEIDEDLEFQRRSWKAQRVGWMVMGLVALTALLGLFGSGPLSSATAGDAGSPLRVEYERFARHAAPSLLRIHPSAGVVRDGQTRIQINRAWLDRVQVQQITPQPERVETAGEWVIYAFNATDPNHPGPIAYHVTMRRFGLILGRVGTDTGYEVSFHQYVYP